MSQRLPIEEPVVGFGGHLECCAEIRSQHYVAVRIAQGCPSESSLEIDRQIHRLSVDEQIGQLDQEMASLLSQHQDAVERLVEVPGLGVDSAQHSR